MSNTYCVVFFCFICLRLVYGGVQHKWCQFLWINVTDNLKSSKKAITNYLDNALKIKFLNGKSKCVLLNAMVSMFSEGICNVHDVIL